MKNLNLLFYLCTIFFCYLVQNTVGLEAEGIIGGDEAPEAKYKYQIALFNWDFVCGGSIIAENFILTAAHCFINPNGSYEANKYFVFANVTDLRDETKMSHKISAAVDKIYVHRGDLVRSTDVDMAVVKLKSNLGLEKYSSYLSKLNLPEGNDTYVGRIATVAGYGINKMNATYNSETGNVTIHEIRLDEKLNSLPVKILSNEDCWKKRTMEPSKLCGYIKQRNQKLTAPCGGDSGGALVVDNTVIGIVSNGMDGCLEYIKPTAYTRVSYYTQFIRNILDGHPDEDAAVFDTSVNYEEEMTAQKWGAKVIKHPFYDNI